MLPLRQGRRSDAARQAEGAVGVGDVAEDTAGADRSQLLIISDQSDTRTATDGKLDVVSRVMVSAMPLRR
jgi:hypothetical protein